MDSGNREEAKALEVETRKKNRRMCGLWCILESKLSHHLGHLIGARLELLEALEWRNNMIRINNLK